MATGLWLRLYVEILNSRKIQSLDPELFKFWVNLMCIAKSCAGLIPTVDDIAWRLREDREEIRRRLQELMDRRLVDETDMGLQMHDWDEHQYGSDSSTERVREFRKRKTATTGNVSVKQSETLPKRFTETKGNVSETAQSREEKRRTEKSRADSEALVDRFRDWIAEYPNQMKVDQAARDWVDMVTNGEITEENIDEVFAGLRRYKRSALWAKERGKYICEPSTFLRGNEKHTGRMWMDHPAPVDEDDKPTKRSRDGIDPNAEWIAPWEN